MTDSEAFYRARTPRSLEWFERTRRVMPGVAKGAYYYAPYPLTIAHAEGCILRDVDGNEYVDFANHHTAQILGHGHPAVLRAIRDRIEDGIAVGGPMGVETELAEELCSRIPSLDMVRFCNSGTEATLHAIRLARGFTGRSLIAKFEGGYHGSHDAVEISVAPDLSRSGPPDKPLPVANTGGMTPHALDDILILPYDNEEAVERLVESAREKLACVLLDPRAGILRQRPEFIRAVRDITRKYGVLLLFDEIVAFRGGPGGLQQRYGIEPDLTTLGKIVGGGFPVGAFGGRKDMMSLLDPTGGPTGFSQSGTFSAHPVAMAAGLAMLRRLTPEAFDHLNRLSDRLETGLIRVFDRLQITARTAFVASAFSVYFTDREPFTYRDIAAADRKRAQRVFLSLLNRGYFLSSGLSMCALSTPMTEKHIDGLIRAVEQALTEE